MYGFGLHYLMVCLDGNAKVDFLPLLHPNDKRLTGPVSIILMQSGC